MTTLSPAGRAAVGFAQELAERLRAGQKMGREEGGGEAHYSASSALRALLLLAQVRLFIV